MYILNILQFILKLYLNKAEKSTAFHQNNFCIIILINFSYWVYMIPSIMQVFSYGIFQ